MRYLHHFTKYFAIFLLEVRRSLPFDNSVTQDGKGLSVGPRSGTVYHLVCMTTAEVRHIFSDSVSDEH